MPHINLRVSSQSGHPDLLYSQEWVNVIFLHLWPQKLYRAFRFGTLWLISCSYPRHSQLTRHSLMLANGRIRQSLTALVVSAVVAATTLTWCNRACHSDDYQWDYWNGSDLFIIHSNHGNSENRILVDDNKIWRQCLVPTLTTRFASEVGNRMTKF